MLLRINQFNYFLSSQALYFHYCLVSFNLCLKQVYTFVYTKEDLRMFNHVWSCVIIFFIKLNQSTIETSYRYMYFYIQMVCLSIVFIEPNIAYDLSLYPGIHGWCFKYKVQCMVSSPVPAGVSVYHAALWWKHGQVYLQLQGLATHIRWRVTSTGLNDTFVTFHVQVIINKCTGHQVTLYYYLKQHYISLQLWYIFLYK